MHYRTTNCDVLMVAGLNVRTTNQKESHPEHALIPGLWKRFFEERWNEQIPSAVNRGVIYAVYSDYDSDASGPYSLTVGLPVDPRVAVSSRLTRVTIPAGDYLQFTAEGDMPGSLTGAWMRIWDYFSSSNEPRRSYQSDYELHELKNPERVEIFVGIRQD